MQGFIEVAAKGDTGKVWMGQVSIDRLVPTDWNPNSMTKEKFNALFDNMAENGCVEPIYCRPLDDAWSKFEIVGGHHRYEIAKLLDLVEVPVVVKEGMTSEDVKFQNVKMNVIKGKIDPVKFTKMYEELALKYDKDDIMIKMGMTNADELNKLIVSVKSSLPKEMQSTFDAAKGQIKTVDDLVLVLNRLFQKQAGLVEKYHYMILDFEGKESIWVRMKKDQFLTAKDLLTACHKHKVPVDELINRVFELFLEQPQEFQDLVFGDIEKVEDEEQLEVPESEPLDQYL